LRARLLPSCDYMECDLPPSTTPVPATVAGALQLDPAAGACMPTQPVRPIDGSPAFADQPKVLLAAPQPPPLPRTLPSPSDMGCTGVSFSFSLSSPLSPLYVTMSLSVPL
jgi:hypothetical protein